MFQNRLQSLTLGREKFQPEPLMRLFWGRNSVQASHTLSLSLVISLLKMASVSVPLRKIDGEMAQTNYQRDWTVSRFKKEMIAKAVGKTGKEELKRDEHKSYRVMWHS